LARFDWVILYREAKLEERIRAGSLTVTSEAFCGKTTQPKEWLTAKWGRSTSRGGTAGGQQLWTSSQSQEDDPDAVTVGAEQSNRTL
jgi:hypothetical protein